MLHSPASSRCAISVHALSKNWLLFAVLLIFGMIQVEARATDSGHAGGCLHGETWDHKLSICRPAHHKVWKKLHMLMNPCAGVQNSYGFLETGSKHVCRCRIGYVWNGATRSCSLNCEKIPNSNGKAAINGQCNCKPGYSWTHGSHPSCNINCKLVSNSVGVPRFDHRGCNCNVGFVWNQLSSSCEKDCSKVKDAIAPFNSGASCNCRPGFTWNTAKQQCWVSCAGQLFVDTARPNINAHRCHCRKPTVWLSARHKCVVNCSFVANSQSQGINPSDTCVCNAGFTWNSQSLTCSR